MVNDSKEPTLYTVKYKARQIQKLKCLSCRPTVVFASSIEARC